MQQQLQQQLLLKLLEKLLFCATTSGEQGLVTKEWRENGQGGKKRSACLTAGRFRKREGLLKQLAGKLVRRLKGPPGCLAAADGQQDLNTTDNMFVSLCLVCWYLCWVQVSVDTAQLFCCAFDLCLVLASLHTQISASSTPQGCCAKWPSSAGGNL